MVGIKVKPVYSLGILARPLSTLPVIKLQLIGSGQLVCKQHKGKQNSAPFGVDPYDLAVKRQYGPNAPMLFLGQKHIGRFGMSPTLKMTCGYVNNTI